MKLDNNQIEQFQTNIWQFYEQKGRMNLPWRQPSVDDTFDPYEILVSEIMLQQTQVPRVIAKYNEFLRTFPTIGTLASAELGDVLRVWQGLGYNRRAKFIWQAAKELKNLPSFPTAESALVTLPGVGKNTAKAVLAYAFNQPTVFVETNIRTVYIHHFFHENDIVSDNMILGYMPQTIDRERPREFYWALMDYGSFLKSTVKNNSQSKHYSKQSKFEGSRRQIRGLIISELTISSMDKTSLNLKINDSRLEQVLDGLVNEGMIIRAEDQYRLA